MKFVFCLMFFVWLFSPVNAQTVKGPLGEVFEMRVIGEPMSDPWEITYGPDGNLWVTESKGYRVNLINSTTGEKKVLVDLNNQKNFPRYDKISDEDDGGKSLPQGGLMGMALHPLLLKEKPFVYVAYVYKFEGAAEAGKGCKPENGGCFYRTKIVRLTFDSKTKTLSDPVTLCDSIPGSNDHNGGRLIVGQVGGKNYLFYSVGDMGAGQFDNVGRKNHAQQTDFYEGKILRFNVEPDGDKDQKAKWIPNDNPFNSQKQNAVWSYGHRNPQGLAFAIVTNKEIIYSSEHGPFSDDEVNIIEKGKNYGHPLVLGFDDNNYNGLAAGVSDKKNIEGKWHTTYPTILDEKANAERIGARTYRNPIISLYPNSNSFLNKVFKQYSSGGESEIEWPSEAPSSIEVYTSSSIPNWKNSLLLPTLKSKKILRLKLNDKGDEIEGDTITYFKSEARYRDLAISPDGLKIYAITDSSTITSGPTEENPEKISYAGRIIEFTYIPKTKGPGKKENQPKSKEAGFLERRNKNE